MICLTVSDQVSPKKSIIAANGCMTQCWAKDETYMHCLAAKEGYLADVYFTFGYCSIVCIYCYLRWR